MQPTASYERLGHVFHFTLLWNSLAYSVNHSMYRILTEYFWEFQSKTALKTMKHAWSFYGLNQGYF